MTKKMFQVTRAGMVAVTIFICLNLLLDKKVMVGEFIPTEKRERVTAKIISILFPRVPAYPP